jgi:ribosomal protein S5
MKHRKFVIASALVMIGVACAIAVLALYSSRSVRASAPSLPDALNNIPSDYQFISGINVQIFVTSPYYARLRQKQDQTPPIGSDLATFIEQTGVDPAREVSYLVFAGGSKGQGVGIAVGTFNPDKIISYIRSKASPVEIEYADARVIMIPDKNGTGVQNGIAFLSDREVAVGNLDSIKSVLDTSRGTKANILSNPGMSSLISNIKPEEMFWFAGNASGLLARAPVSTPLGQNVSSIRSIVGTLNITEAVVGKITATAVDPEAAAKLTDVFKGFIALGQLSGNQNPDMNALLDGLIVSQNASQVTLSLNVPVDLLEKLQSNRLSIRSGAAGMGVVPQSQQHYR